MLYFTHTKRNVAHEQRTYARPAHLVRRMQITIVVYLLHTHTTQAEQSHNLRDDIFALSHVYPLHLLRKT